MSEPSLPSNLNKLKVVDLKKLLKERKLRVSGRKEELIQRLISHQEKIGSVLPTIPILPPPLLSPTSSLPVQIPSISTNIVPPNLLKKRGGNNSLKIIDEHLTIRACSTIYELRSTKEKVTSIICFIDNITNYYFSYLLTFLNKHQHIRFFEIVGDQKGNQNENKNELISNFIIHNKSLTKLVLNIDLIDTKLLFECLKVNSTLQTLKIFGIPNIRIFGDILRVNNGIKKLKIINTSKSFFSLEYFLKGLSSNTTLTYLDLDFWYEEDSPPQGIIIELKIISEILESNKTLTYLGIGIDFSDKIEKDETVHPYVHNIRSILERNKGLTSISSLPSSSSSS